MKAAELRKWRDDRGMSQAELAQALGVHIVTVARWETDARKIPVLLVLALETLERRLASKQKSKQ